MAAFTTHFPFINDFLPPSTCPINIRPTPAHLPGMASLLLGMAAPSSAMVPTEVLRIAIPPAVLPRLHITPHRSRLGDLHRAREVRQRRVAAVAAAAAPASPPSAAGEADALRLAASLNFADLWSLLRPDWKLVAACAVATLVSVGSFVRVYLRVCVCVCCQWGTPTTTSHHSIPYFVPLIRSRVVA